MKKQMLQLNEGVKRFVSARIAQQSTQTVFHLDIANKLLTEYQEKLDEVNTTVTMKVKEKFQAQLDMQQDQINNANRSMKE